MLTSEMRTLICENTIGLVATVTPEGKPAVSPKATSVVLSPSDIAFLDIRSPKTRQNIKANPNMTFIRGCKLEYKMEAYDSVKTILKIVQTYTLLYICIYILDDFV